jgi:hypothetical protein
MRNLIIQESRILHSGDMKRDLYGIRRFNGINQIMPIAQMVYYSSRDAGNNLAIHTIFDLNGRLMISKKDETNHINVMSLGSGVYVRRFIFNNYSRGY